MSTAEIASRLVAFCRRGDYEAAHKELYADDAVSIEPDSTPETTVRGHAGLAEKSKMFADTFEVHGGSVSDPVVAGNFFSCAMTADVMEKKSGARLKLEEICLYEVRDGKIVREQFFFQPKD
ncbi:MAG TPA: nuclear transport factor 2 family protein [Opitutaceae bacterium]|nr:nuclear transport factor 2 family protein [Opitutaceae bacterium]